MDGWIYQNFHLGTLKLNSLFATLCNERVDIMQKSGRSAVKQRRDALTLGTTHCQRCILPPLIIMIIILTLIKFITIDNANDHDECYFGSRLILVTVSDQKDAKRNI